MGVIELDDNKREFKGERVFKKRINNNRDNVYNVLNYIGIIKLDKDDPRMVHILNNSRFTLYIDRGDIEPKVKLEDCCKTSWNIDKGIVNMQINYNVVTIMGIESMREYNINKIF